VTKTITLMARSAINSIGSCFPITINSNNGQLTDEYANSLAKSFAKNLGYSTVIKVWQNSNGAFAEVK
jgi:hypothetical protein